MNWTLAEPVRWDLNRGYPEGTLARGDINQGASGTRGIPSDSREDI